MPAVSPLPAQLLAFLEGVWPSAVGAPVGRLAVQRAAAALHAETVAIISGDRVLAVAGHPENKIPERDLIGAAAAGQPRELAVPGTGSCPVAAVPLDYPAGAVFLVARGGPRGGLEPGEEALLRDMARVTSLALRSQHLLAGERAARESSERRARENALLVAELSPRRIRLTELADEQAALRRVAVLVASQAPAETIFTAVAEEVGQVVPGTDVALIGRYEQAAVVEIVGGWSRAGEHRVVGRRWALSGQHVSALVFTRHQAVRADPLRANDGAPGPIARELGMRSAVGAPITVGGRLWGVMIAASRNEDTLAASTEDRLAGFTELVATAIANAQARVELSGYAEEQAALRRVATLVAHAAPPEQVFSAVTAEIGQLFAADVTLMSRYDADGSATVAGVWTRTGAPVPTPAGSRLSLGGQDLHTEVFRTHQPARMDGYAGASAAAADFARLARVSSGVAVPVSVGGRLWGVIGIASGRELPGDTEVRLAGFTELVASAIANAEAQAALTASRARIMAAADTARQRIERDLHDGAQQRLVSLALQLRAAQAAAPPEAADLAQQLDALAAGLQDVLGELQEIARGIHPAVLARGGLRPALRALARRSTVPVEVTVRAGGRLPGPVEIAVYYAVSEALTNAAKHADASFVVVDVAAAGDVLQVCVRDDGRGGAAFGRGSGLVGLRDRVEALGGQVELASPPGAGTTVQLTLPLGQAAGRPGGGLQVPGGGPGVPGGGLQVPGGGPGVPGGGSPQVPGGGPGAPGGAGLRGGAGLPVAGIPAGRWPGRHGAAATGSW
jgi:signal transduction histidine kinase